MRIAPVQLNRRRLSLSLSLCLLTVLAIPNPSRADGEIEAELASIATQLSKFLKSYEKTTVTVGQFSPPPQVSASAGPGIAKILAEELRESGIEIKRLADLGIKGEYRIVLKDKETGPEAQIKGDIEDLEGKQLFSFTRNVRGEATLAYLFGMTVNLPPSATEKERGQMLTASLMAPQTFVDTKSARVSAGAESPYGLEILVKGKDGYQPRTPTEEDRLAFVKVDRNELYAVKLINDSDMDAAVTLTIDGLNMFAFSENQEYSYVIVPKKSQGMIMGWHRTNQRSDAFQVMEYSQSEVGKLLQSPTKNVGTVTATFAAAWPRDQKAPSDERNSAVVRRGRDATGRGPSLEANYKVVERILGVVRSSVTVRYTKGE